VGPPAAAEEGAAGGRGEAEAMTEDEAFLQDIVDHPEDDGPRLVYADWLEDHGDPDRAEFIRVQIELARLEEWDERWDELKQREQRALRGYRQEWLGAAERLVNRWEFRRGFLDSAFVRPKDLVAFGEELFRRTPLRHVRLSGTFRDPALRALADSPHLAKVRSLEFFYFRLDAARLAVLVASPHLGGLRALQLEGCRIRLEGARLLAESPNLAGLTSLRLRGCEVGPAGAAALAGSPHLARLEALDLTGNWIADEGLAALADSPHLANLTDLRVQANRIGRGGVEALAAARHWRLARLSLGTNPLGNEGVRLLTASPNVGRLTWLQLGANHIVEGPAAAAAVAESPQLARLTTLIWYNSSMGDDGARALAASPHLSHLVELALTSHGIKDAGAQALLHSPHLTRLRRVDLRDNSLSRKQKTLWRARFGRNVSF
jgi:uncharacterized protein (TIGR02996 family)